MWRIVGAGAPTILHTRPGAQSQGSGSSSSDASPLNPSPLLLGGVVPRRSASSLSGLSADVAEDSSLDSSRDPAAPAACGDDAVPASSVDGVALLDEADASPASADGCSGVSVVGSSVGSSLGAESTGSAAAAGAVSAAGSSQGSGSSRREVSPPAVEVGAPSVPVVAAASSGAAVVGGVDG